jgi:hypothetical protein
MTEEQIKRIVSKVAASFPSFGGGHTSEWNPIAAALQNRPPMFAAGADIEAVVRFVCEQIEGEEEK